MGKRIALICTGCGADFQKWAHRVREHNYCTRACYLAQPTCAPRPAARKGIALNCATCGAGVVRRPSEVLASTYCSRSCYEASRGAPDQTCSLCGTTYNRPPASRSTVTDRNYCSWGCYQKDPDKPTNRGFVMSAETRTKISAAARSRDPSTYRRKPPQPCAHCGTMFKAHGTARRYCSAACWYDAVRDDPALSGRYLDGTTIRKEGRLWFANRAAALLRDGNACTRCGSTLRSKLMHVHHVVPLRTFADHQVAEAHALSNLTTLCAYCHPAVEWVTTREYAAAAS